MGVELVDPFPLVLVCEPAPLLEPQAVSMATMIRTKVQDTVFIKDSGLRFLWGNGRFKWGAY